MTRKVKPEPDNSGPAFPSTDAYGFVSVGISKREYFAAAALTGLISQVNMPNEVYARMAVGIADELLKTLEST
jgi:hypothetical protein